MDSTQTSEVGNRASCTVFCWLPEFQMLFGHAAWTWSVQTTAEGWFTWPSSSASCPSPVGKKSYTALMMVSPGLTTWSMGVRPCNHDYTCACSHSRTLPEHTVQESIPSSHQLCPNGVQCTHSQVAMQHCIIIIMYMYYNPGSQAHLPPVFTGSVDQLNHISSSGATNITTCIYKYIYLI